MSTTQSPLPLEHSLLITEKSQIWLNKAINLFSFTFQELKQMNDIIRDFEMWCMELATFKEFDLSSYNGKVHDRVQKKKFYGAIRTLWEETKLRPTQYTSSNSPESITHKEKTISRFEEVDSGKKIFGKCPVASEKTVCCNLKTIDAVQGCAFGCTYCSIQTFYEQDSVRFESNLLEKLRDIPIEPNKWQHFGTGQSSDSLLWGNKNNNLKNLFTFAQERPNVLLELKTKSANVNFLDQFNQENFLIPPNVFFTWSMNTDTIVQNEELHTPPFPARLHAALKTIKSGRKIGLHFHPVIYYENFEKEYAEIIHKITEKIDPNDVVFVSIGTLTFIKPVVKELRKSNLSTKILQIPLSPSVSGFSYPEDIKIKLFSHVFQSFKPWHGKVFFYLCMEERKYWQAVFNHCFDSNKEFEAAINTAIASKLGVRLN